MQAVEPFDFVLDAPMERRVHSIPEALTLSPTSGTKGEERLQVTPRLQRRASFVGCVLPPGRDTLRLLIRVCWCWLPDGDGEGPQSAATAGSSVSPAKHRRPMSLHSVVHADSSDFDVSWCNPPAVGACVCVCGGAGDAVSE